jgi:hypothetical protein
MKSEKSGGKPPFLTFELLNVFSFDLTGETLSVKERS